MIFSQLRLPRKMLIGGYKFNKNSIISLPFSQAIIMMMTLVPILENGWWTGGTHHQQWHK